MATPEGFTEFVLARQAALLRTAYLLTGHAQDAEDLVQTTLVKVVPQWRRIADNPEPYVRRVLVNENVSRWRRRRWREHATDVLPEVLADAPGPRRADRRARRRWPDWHHDSGRCWCCATTRACRRPRSPRRSASHPGR